MKYKCKYNTLLLLPVGHWLFFISLICVFSTHQLVFQILRAGGGQCVFMFFVFIHLFIYLAVPVLVVACGIFSCGMQSLSCGMWDLVLWPGIKPGPPAFRAWSLSHWTTREVPGNVFLMCWLLFNICGVQRT